MVSYKLNKSWHHNRNKQIDGTGNEYEHRSIRAMAMCGFKLQGGVGTFDRNFKIFQGLSQTLAVHFSHPPQNQTLQQQGGSESDRLIAL